jgi:CRISPR system Cascade subunit CasA
MIKQIHFAAGFAIANDVNSPDPMVSYKVRKNALFSLSFKEGRACWRDLPSLIPDVNDGAAHSAAVLDRATFLKEIIGEGHLDLSIFVAGVAGDQAKIRRWRFEQIVLPVSLMRDRSLASEMREQVDRAEKTHEKLKKIAVNMIVASMPGSKSKSRESRRLAYKLFDSGSATPAFFAAIEPFLPRLLHLIAELRDEEAATMWSQALHDAIDVTWGLVSSGIGQSPTALRAEALAHSKVSALMSSLRSNDSIVNSFKEVQA